MQLADPHQYTVFYNDTPFIGRTFYLDKLNSSWDTHCVFGVFGIRSVGKSSLVTKFLEHKVKLTAQNNYRDSSPLLVYKLDLRVTTDILSLYSNLCACLNIRPEVEATCTERWINHVTRALNRGQIDDTSTVLFFDNVENVIESEIADPFLSLIVTLLKRCPNVKTFLTSTTRVQFSQHGNVFFSCDLLPLTGTESFDLLKSIAPRVELNEYGEALIKLSEGLPLLILMIGAELNDVSSHMTPGKMVETLSKCRLQTCSGRDYSDWDLTNDVGEIYRNFILRLTKVYQERLKTLQFIPGSFNASESMQMLGYRTVAMVKGDVLVHLQRRFMITYDMSNKRFDIQGILRESLQMHFTLRNISEVRSSYCRTFSHVIKTISDRLGTAECSKALKEFAIEQTNLRKFLHQVLFTMEDTYPFFLEVASSCALLIENFMEGESEVFYNGCLRAAEEYGRSEDKAIIYVSIGSLYTNIKEDLPRGAEMLQSAIDCFLDNADTKEIHLATAYQRLGWNLYKQGKNVEAVVTLEKSYAITSRLDNNAMYLRVQNMNSLGLVNDMLGNFRAAAEYHFQALHTRRSRLGKEHPTIGPTLNNIGTHFKKKGNSAKAMDYFCKGLKEKKTHKDKLAVLSLVDSLCNIAEEFIRLQEYWKAHNYLDDARNLIREQEIPSKEGLAMVYHIRGRVFQAQRLYTQACDSLKESISIRQEAFPDCIEHFESIVDYANVEVSLGNVENALKIASHALKLKEKVMKTMPPYTLHYLKCLECMATIYKGQGSRRYYRILQDMESELMRLERVHIEGVIEGFMDLLMSKLASVRCQLDNRSRHNIT